MATATVEFDTFADVLQCVGRVSSKRVLLKPVPGTATEKDLIKLLDRGNKRLCELIDGVLVEKPMGGTDGFVGPVIMHYLFAYVKKHKVGAVFGSDSPFRLAERIFRLPDISFVSWKRFGRNKVPARLPVIDAVPELAVEILSPSNTRKEILLKLQHYFDAGVLEVWLVDPRKRTGRVFTSPSVSRELKERDAFTGGDILPGFRLPLSEIFSSIEP